MARLAIKFEENGAPEEVFAKTGNTWNEWALHRDDGQFRTLTFSQLQDPIRREKFTLFDVVGTIAKELPAPDTMNVVWAEFSAMTIADFSGGVWTIPIVSSDPVPEEIPPLTAPQWITLIKGLPAASRSALRTARDEALADAANASDALSDIDYLNLQEAGKAAAFLSDRESVKPYNDVRNALVLIGIILTAPQEVNFDTRWMAVAAL